MNKKFNEFKVTAKLEEWSLDNFGYDQLPHLLISGFRKNWKGRVEDGNTPKWNSADMAFMRWMRQNSPGGDFYNAKKWEENISLCKQEINKQGVPPVLKDFLPVFKKAPTPESIEKGRRALQVLKSKLNED
jgi:hypothetical protein